MIIYLAKNDNRALDHGGPVIMQAISSGLHHRHLPLAILASGITKGIPL